MHKFAPKMLISVTQMLGNACERYRGTLRKTTQNGLYVLQIANITVYFITISTTKWQLIATTNSDNAQKLQF